MALKTYNYKVEEMGITLPVAIAIAQPNTANGTAVFQIGASRELVEQGKIVKTIKVYGIKYDRNENPFETAYKFAKTPREVEYEDGYKETIIPPFVCWEDDYV